MPSVVSSAKTPSIPEPKGEVVIRTIAMPGDANANGAIFGGWIMAQMDLGGAILARSLSRSRVTTAAVEAMRFVAPINSGDVVTCYARVARTGRTSVGIALQVSVARYVDGSKVMVTHGTFTYVALDEIGKPLPINRP